VGGGVGVVGLSVFVWGGGRGWVGADWLRK